MGKVELQFRKLADVCAIDKAQGAHKNLPYVGLEQIESQTAQFNGTLDPTSVKSSTFKFTSKHLLYGRLRPYLNKVLAPNFDGHCSTEIFPILPNEQVSRKYLLYWFLMPETNERINATCTGARMPRANMEKVLDFDFPYVPRLEQKRTVRILDEVFEAIATATANAEKNLQNARALFESHLQAVFSQRGEGWEETTLGAEVDLLSGFPFKSNRYSDSEKDIRLLRGDNIVQGSLRWDDVKRWPISDAAEYQRYRLRAGDVVLAMDRPWVKAGLKISQVSHEDLPSLLVQRTSRLRGIGRVDNRFLLFLLRSESFTRHILGVQTGIGVPHISAQQIKDFRFYKPQMNMQEAIANTLENIDNEIQTLESLYRSKLSALDSLKKSILHKAFSGQLTSSIPRTIIPFPTKIPGIPTADLHAGILALAFQYHENNGNMINFGHVKAEKISHMVESHLGIELERNPVKDAAGPNDFQRLNDVEKWAESQGYFKVRKVNGRYFYTKMPKFEDQIIKVSEVLGDKIQGVIKLMQDMVGMDKLGAEVFATVYAAWNNLLLDDNTPSDEQIVWAAREDWHVDKREIPREKFFAEIDRLRREGYSPKGKGKRVLAKT